MIELLGLRDHTHTKVLMKDYYEILGIGKNATEQEIKKAYRKLSMKFHPDKNDGDKYFESMFNNIKEAYETLSEPEMKGKYDKAYDQFITRQNSEIEDFIKQETEKGKDFEDRKAAQTSHNDESEKFKQRSEVKTQDNQYDSYGLLILVVIVIIAVLVFVSIPKTENVQTESQTSQEESKTDSSSSTMVTDSAMITDSSPSSDIPFIKIVPRDMFVFSTIKYLAHNNLGEEDYREEETEHTYISISDIKKISDIDDDKKQLFMDEFERSFMNYIEFNHDGYEKIKKREIFIFKTYTEASQEAEKIKRSTSFQRGIWNH